jgi:hypothetical protein
VDGVAACFNFVKYKEETKADQKAFFKQFLHMQMFTRLLERKLWAQKNEDITDLAFFDEHIRLKLMRKKKTFKPVRLQFYSYYIWVENLRQRLPE